MSEPAGRRKHCNACPRPGRQARRGGVPLAHRERSERGRGPAGFGERGRSPIVRQIPCWPLFRTGSEGRAPCRFCLHHAASSGSTARGLGVKPSAWARAVLRDALDTRSHEVRDLAAHAVALRPAPEVSEAVEQLRRVGVNLNQVLRRGDVVDADLLCELRDAVSALRGSLGDRTVV